MTVTFIQTADAFGYKDMLDQTSRTVVEYCRRNGFGYESFIGIKRGTHPWQASFNRILMLHDMVQAGRTGWVVHLDADAYIYDLSYDLRGYLADKADRVGVLTPVPGQPVPWSVNNGVMMLNLDHPQCRELIRLWHERFMAVSDEQLEALVHWPQDINDQTFLVEILDRNPPIRDAVFYENAELINACYASFIRQLLRAHFPSQEVRTNAIRNAIAEVLPGVDDFNDRAYPVLMSALYRVLLHRDPEAGALDHFRGRFLELGVESAFRETLAEFVRSREYLDKLPQRPVSPTARVRAAYRWILGRLPSDEETNRYGHMLETGALDVPALRDLLLKEAGLAGGSGMAIPSRTGFFRRRR